MKSEALRNIRTMRDVKTSLGVARSQKLRTTNALSKTKEEIVHLESVTERRVEQVLEKEKRRFAAQEASIKRSRHRVLKAREKLAMTINKNRALTELRRQLQEGRWEGNDPVVPKVEIPAPEQNPRQIELRY
jgi:TFIIF-interacting CTD phosphatase-like protein